MKRTLIALALVVMLALAGCGGDQREEGEPAEDGVVVENYEVVEIEGETYVCFNQADDGAEGEEMECLPHNSTATTNGSTDERF